MSETIVPGRCDADDIRNPSIHDRQRNPRLIGPDTAAACLHATFALPQRLGFIGYASGSRFLDAVFVRMYSIDEILRSVQTTVRM